MSDIPSLQPTTSAPTVHPFTGYAQVGGTNAGECADVGGVLFSYAEFDEISSPNACALECSGLATSEQVGLGFRSSVSGPTCRCYFNGEAPDDSGMTFTSSDGRSGSGQVAGVNNVSQQNWQCYRRIVRRVLDMFCCSRRLLTHIYLRSV